MFCFKFCMFIFIYLVTSPLMTRLFGIIRLRKPKRLRFFVDYLLFTERCTCRHTSELLLVIHPTSCFCWKHVTFSFFYIFLWWPRFMLKIGIERKETNAKAKCVRVFFFFFFVVCFFRGWGLANLTAFNTWLVKSIHEHQNINYIL